MSSPELESAIRAAAPHVDPHWDAQRIEAGLLDLRRRKRAVAARRTTTWIAVAAAVALGIGWGLGSRWGGAPSESGILELADGSTVERLDTTTELALVELSDQHATLRLDAGRAEFDVTDRPQRQFRVEAGDIQIHSNQAHFRVEREAERLRVAVESGSVRVEWASGSRTLTASEFAWFPPTVTTREIELRETELEPMEEDAIARPGSETADPFVDRPNEVAPVESRRRRSRARSSRDWQHLASQGEFDRAYREIGEELPAGFGELLLAADAARFSGHPAEASRWLRRALERDSQDPRAPLAAFTLGRVLLNQLGQPRQAANAFAEARSLAPRGPLAEDALAREVECWSRVGDSALAERRARLYLEQYPNGRRVVAVRRYAGLE